MRGPICGLLTLVAVSVLGSHAAGQGAAVGASGIPGRSTAQMQRLPYSAEFKTTRVQTLADGSTITHETTEVMARDSEGRTYQLSSSASQGEDQRMHTSVDIDDPVAKTSTHWFVPGRRVTVDHRVDLGAAHTGCGVSISAQVAAPEQTEEQTIKPAQEDLGKQTFQGIEARGSRKTISYPEGTIGNSAPLVASFEVWFSSTPGLSGINVHQVSDDPRMGKTTRELVKFTQGEPDLSMFQPPDGYETLTQETHGEVRCP
jgi:hypothetical protein